MIRRLALLLTGLAAFTAASPALGDAAEDYMAACMEATSDDTELCTCKTEQAAKLVDEEMLGYLVTALADPAKFSEMIDKGEVPQKVVTKWPFYVRDSNKICLAPE